MSESESSGLRDKMDELQKFCHRAERTLKKKKQYFKDQLEKLVILQDPKWSICDVCLSSGSEPEDFMMRCQVCNVVAHQSCYGPRWNSNDEDFLCFRCVYLVNNKKSWNAIRCALCPEMRGVMRPMFEDLMKPWCHKICGNYTTGCWWDDRFGFLEQDVNTTFKWKSNMACQICDSKYGRVIGCDFKNCTFKAHITCCVKIGVIREYSEMHSQSEKMGYDDESYVLVVHCYNHMKKDQSDQLQKAVSFYEKYNNRQNLFYFLDPENDERTNFMNQKKYCQKLNEALLSLVRKKKPTRSKDDLESVEDSQQFNEQQQKPPQQKIMMKEQKVVAKVVPKFEDFRMMQYFCDEEIDNYEQSIHLFKSFLEQHYKSPEEVGNILLQGMQLNHELLHLSTAEIFDFLEPVIPPPYQTAQPIERQPEQKGTQLMNTQPIQSGSIKPILQKQNIELESPHQNKLQTDQVENNSKDQMSPLPQSDGQTTPTKQKFQELKQVKDQVTKDGRAVKRCRNSPDINQVNETQQQNKLKESSDAEKKAAIRPLQVDFQPAINILVDNTNQRSILKKPMIDKQAEKPLQVSFQEPEIKKKIKQIKDKNCQRPDDLVNAKYYKMIHDTMNQLKFKRIFRQFEDDDDDEQEETQVNEHLVMEIHKEAKLHIYKRAKAVYEKLI